MIQRIQSIWFFLASFFSGALFIFPLYAYTVEGAMSSSLLAASNEYMMPPPLPHPNITAGIGSYYMDLIKEEEQKSEGRKQKFIKLKSEVKTREEKVEHFKKLTKVSSSVLATNNHCVLDQMILIRCRKRMKWMRQLNR
jgi:hypothetical protein